MIVALRSNAWLLGLGLVATGLGSALAVAPLPWLFTLLAITTVVLVTLVEPLVGLGLALVVGPFRALEQAVTPGILPIDVGQILLAFSLAAWFARQVANRRPVLRWAPLAVPLLLYIVTGGVSLLGALSLGYGLKELIKWAEILVVMLVVFTAGREKLGWGIAVLLGTGALEAVVGVWQFALRGVGPAGFHITGHLYRAYGTFEQPNPFAGFLGLVLPVALGLAAGSLWKLARQFWSGGPYKLETTVFRPVFFLALAGLLAAGILSSWSRGAWLGVAAALAVMALTIPRRPILGWLCLLFVASLAVGLWQTRLAPASIANRVSETFAFLRVYDVRGVDINDANYAVVERLAHWQAAEGMIRDHPWLGVGWGNYEPVYPGYRLLNWPYPLGHAHNIYLNVTAETGLIGLVTYVVFWSTVFALTLRALYRLDWPARGLALGLLGSWVHISVHGVLDNLYVNNIPLHLGLMLGLLCVLNSREYIP